MERDGDAGVGDMERDTEIRREKQHQCYMKEKEEIATIEKEEIGTIEKEEIATIEHETRRQRL